MECDLKKEMDEGDEEALDGADDVDISLNVIIRQY